MLGDSRIIIELILVPRARESRTSRVSDATHGRSPQYLWPTTRRDLRDRSGGCHNISDLIVVSPCNSRRFVVNSPESAFRVKEYSPVKTQTYTFRPARYNAASRPRAVGRRLEKTRSGVLRPMDYFAAVCPISWNVRLSIAEVFGVSKKE